MATRPLTRRFARGELFVSGVLFGLMAVTGRLAYAHGAGFSTGQLVVVRFAIGVAAMLATFRVRPGTFRPLDRPLLVVRGLVGGTAVLFYFLALGQSSAGEATLLNNLAPFLATVFAAIALKERATAHLWAALAVATIGIGLVVVSRGQRLALGPGVAAGLGAAAFGAVANLVIRKLRRNHNTPTVFFAFCVGGLALSLPFAGGVWPREPYVWALGIATGLLAIGAQMLMTDSLGALTVPEGAVWQELAPVASYLWGFALLDERLDRYGAIGVTLVVAAVIWGAARGMREREEAPVRPEPAP